MRLKTANEYYRQQFGCKVYRLSIDAGFSCPNRDGSCGTRGCIFCDGSGSFAAKGNSVTEQLTAAKERVQSKCKGGKYIAYFQAYTNTYAPVDTLRSLYEEAISFPDIVGLDIATRPDCLPPETIALLAELNERIPVTVELGLQTIHEETAAYIRRGYSLPVYDRAMADLKAANIHVITHVIIGLPGETTEMAAETSEYAAKKGTDGIKFHLLHVLKNTDFAEDYWKGSFQCLTLEEYASALQLCIDRLPDDIVLYRLTGDGAKKDLIAPLWSADKKKVMNYLRGVLK